MADENRVNFFTSNTFRPISDEEIEEIGKSVNPGEVGDLYGSMTEDDIDAITGIVSDSTEDDFHDEIPDDYDGDITDQEIDAILNS